MKQCKYLPVVEVVAAPYCCSFTVCAYSARFSGSAFVVGHHEKLAPSPRRLPREFYPAILNRIWNVEILVLKMVLRATNKNEQHPFTAKQTQSSRNHIKTNKSNLNACIRFPLYAWTGVIEGN